uniref:Transposase n=5 Tax=Candidatus Kentrum sp. SD TaxID=2126332 RepID=A0A450YST6_9GAMM|nr:MAG: Transposase [Candidatus Kentron sp. SD]
MRIKTILNRVQKFKSFVYGEVRWAEDEREAAIDVELRPRKNSRPLCPECGHRHRRPGYDKRPTQRFEFIPMWGFKVFFCYAPRRVNCPDCGIHVERMPWVKGKHRLTESYAWFLAGWAKRLSWKEVGEAFHTTWYHVFCSVEMAVSWGREHMDLSGIEAIGVDEIQWQRGHHYLTLVYQIDASCRRLLWIGKNRKVKTLLGFFRWFGKERTEDLQYICSDMWKPYLGSSEKSVGKIWDRQIAKSMIQSDFDTMIGSKPIGFSGSEFSFVVQTLYYPTGESFLGPEPIEQQGSMIP